MKKILLSTILTGSMALILATPLHATNKKIAELTGTTVQEVNALQNAGLPAAAAAKELKAARDQVKAAGTTADSQELKVETFLEAKKNNVPLADIVNEAKLGKKAEDTVKNFVAGGGAGAGAGAGGGVKAPDPVKVHAKSIIPGADKDDIAAVAALEKIGIPLNTITVKQVDTYQALELLKNHNKSPFVITLDAVNAYEQYMADIKEKPLYGEDLLAFIQIQKSPDAVTYKTLLKPDDRQNYIENISEEYLKIKDWTQAIKNVEAAVAALEKLGIPLNTITAKQVNAYRRLKFLKNDDNSPFIITTEAVEAYPKFKKATGNRPGTGEDIVAFIQIQTSPDAVTYKMLAKPDVRLDYIEAIADEYVKTKDWAQAIKNYEAVIAKHLAGAGGGGIDPDAAAFKKDIGRDPNPDELAAYKAIKDPAGAIKIALPTADGIESYLHAKKVLGTKNISDKTIDTLNNFRNKYSVLPENTNLIRLDMELTNNPGIATGFSKAVTPAEKLTYLKGVAAESAKAIADKFKDYEAKLAAAAGGAGGGAGALPADQQALRDTIAAIPNAAGLLAVFDSDPAEFTKVRDATSATNKANPIYLSAKFLAAKTGITFSSTNGKTLMAIIRQFANEPRIVNLTKANFDAYLKLSAAEQASVKTIDDLLNLK